MNLRWPSVALLAALLFLQATVVQGISESGQATAAASGITLIVDFGNGTAVSTSDLVGTTVLEVTESRYTVQIHWYGSLAFVTSIAGVQNRPSNAWQYWVNGAYASVACNVLEVSDGDLIVWNLTTSHFTGNTQGPPASDLLLGVTLVGGFGIAVLSMLYLLAKRRE